MPGNEPISQCTGLVEGDTFTVTVNQTQGAQLLQATAIITVFDLLNGTALIDVDLTNTSNNDNTILSFGLNIDPDATSGSIIDLSATDTDRLTVLALGNFPGFNLVEICAAAQNCSGGGINGGVAPGETDLFRFSLTGAFTAGGQIDLSQFAFKFQGVGGSFEKPGIPAQVPVGGEQVAGAVPMPGSLMLVGTALLTGLVATAALRGLRRS